MSVSKNEDIEGIANVRDIITLWCDFLLWTLNDPDKTQKDVTVKNFARWLARKML
jgi:hypothetical protein